MNQLLFRAVYYIRHCIKSSRGRKGYGIHSPFAFDFVTNVLKMNSDTAYYDWSAIEKLRYEMLSDKQVIDTKGRPNISVSKLTKTSAAPASDAQRIQRIGQFMQSRRILELGTSLGFTTAYLATISDKAKVISIDHDEMSHKYAKQSFKKLSINNITLITDTFDNALPKAVEELKSIDLLYIDGNHTYEATIEYFNATIGAVRPNSVFIFHDIHWSAPMYKAWNEVIANTKITASFEAHNLGIVFFDPDLEKHHYFI